MGFRNSQVKAVALYPTSDGLKWSRPKPPPSATRINGYDFVSSPRKFGARRQARIDQWSMTRDPHGRMLAFIATVADGPVRARRGDPAVLQAVRPWQQTVPAFVEIFADGRWPVVFGNSEQSRAFTYVEKSAPTCLLHSAPDPYRVIQHRRRSVNHGQHDGPPALSRAWGPHAGDPLPARGGSAAVGSRSLTASSVLGTEPTTSFREGLRRTVWACLGSRGGPGTLLAAARGPRGRG